MKRCIVALVLVFSLVATACSSTTDNSLTSSSTSTSWPDAAPPTTTVDILPSSSTAPNTTGATSVGADGVEAGLALLGAWVGPRDGFGDEARRQAILDHEEAIGRKLGLVNEFFRFDLEWSMDRLRWHLDRGTGLMISWNGAPATSILDGSSDNLIRQRAAWTRELGEPLLLRFFWEPDAAKGERWGYHDDPALYEEVWRYVRAIFDDEGVTNAKWVWTPTTWHFGTGFAQEFYPGDDVVDVIGADGYLWAPCRGSIETAEEVFGPFLAWAKDRPQPILVAEWGAALDNGDGSKRQFFDAVSDLFSPMDRLLGLVVFDAIDPNNERCDMRIDSDASSLAAYRRLANDPRFGATAALIAELD